MAKTELIEITDDIDGAADAQPYRIGYMGNWYEIDLAGRHAERVEEFFAWLIPAATRTPRVSEQRRRAARVAPPGHRRAYTTTKVAASTRTIRTWWEAHAKDVEDETGRAYGAFGRIPADVEKLFNEQVGQGG